MLLSISHPLRHSRLFELLPNLRLAYLLSLHEVHDVFIASRPVDPKAKRTRVAGHIRKKKTRKIEQLQSEQCLVTVLGVREKNVQFRDNLTILEMRMKHFIVS